MNTTLANLHPMAVYLDGIWQKVEGAWFGSNGEKARILLNGKEMVVHGKHLMDLAGYGPEDVASEIIQRNISTLPRLSPPKKTSTQPFRLNPQAIPQAYRVVSRNGQPHAVPYENERPPDVGQWILQHLQPTVPVREQRAVWSAEPLPDEER